MVSNIQCSDHKRQVCAAQELLSWTEEGFHHQVRQTLYVPLMNRCIVLPVFLCHIPHLGCHFRCQDVVNHGGFFPNILGKYPVQEI